MPTDDDPASTFMAQALRLAARGLGNVWPNPAVGCVIARGKRIVGRGWTQPGGRPHAETEAVRRAGAAALGATAYVTLEPCAHYGRTPPCTMALLHAGVRRVVAATTDPDPRVDGKGLAQLRQAGVEVEAGVLKTEAEQLNAGFISRIRFGRPLVTLKLATTLDGRIATRAGRSRWITGDAARARGHLLRATHDAIMVGSGTALADDPDLTCRLPGLGERSPVRVVVDGRLRLAPEARMLTGEDPAPVLVLTGPEPDPGRARALAKAGATIVGCPPASDGRLDLGDALQALGRRGLTRLLVDGGAGLAAALLRARLVDRIVWFDAPLLIGGDGRPALDELDVADLSDAIRLDPLPGAATPELAPDWLRVYIVRYP